MTDTKVNITVGVCKRKTDHLYAADCILLPQPFSAPVLDGKESICEKLDILMKAYPKYNFNLVNIPYNSISYESLSASDFAKLDAKYNKKGNIENKVESDGKKAINGVVLPNLDGVFSTIDDYLKSQKK